MSSTLQVNREEIEIHTERTILINKLKYSCDWQFWLGYLISSDDQWEIINYPQLVNIAALIASGLTKQQASI